MPANMTTTNMTVEMETVNMTTNMASTEKTLKYSHHQDIGNRKSSGLKLSDDIVPNGR